MEPELVRRTPFGLAMVRLPGHMRERLLYHGIFPTQTEGELLPGTGPIGPPKCT